jgi:glycosyltransferase involved in cell wall biosynthesis
MKLLICSPYVPFDTARHAGGQTHNYYVKRIKKETQIDIHIVTFANKDEIESIDLNQYGISNSIIIKKNISFPNRIIRKFFWILSKCSPNLVCFDSFNCYLLFKELIKLKFNGYAPDVVELNWTEFVLFLPVIKMIFPKAKYYAVEQDVSFQSYERDYLLTIDINERKNKEQKYITFKKNELEVLKKFDKIFVFNKKDEKLLLENGIAESLTKVIPPYFQTVSFPLSAKRKHEILFYGAMMRTENYLAAIWFIENVFTLLNDEFVFIILGTSPHSDLLKYRNDRIIITGYQSDIQPYFEKALCLVAPLEKGAGIKVKVLEALAAGIPVLGTEVASEGIDVTNGINFLYCKTPLDYYENIMRLFDNTELRVSISTATKEFIRNNYDFDSSFTEYVNILYSL